MELRNIIGGVLSSAAEARSLSDRVSRDLAILYEQDDLMRAFPVPRMEFDKIDIDLKFALQDGGYSTAQEKAALPQSAEASPASELVKLTAMRIRSVLTEAVAGGKLSSVLKFERTKDYEKLGAAAQDEAADLLLSPTTLAAQTPPYEDVTLTAFDARELAGRIVKTWEKQGLAAAKSDRSEAKITELLTSVQREYESELAQLRASALERASIDAIFSYRELVGLPPEVLSTIKLSIQVRNYEWTQVGDREGEPVRKLVPE